MFLLKYDSLEGKLLMVGFLVVERGSISFEGNKSKSNRNIERRLVLIMRERKNNNNRSTTIIRPFTPDHTRTFWRVALVIVIFCVWPITNLRPDRQTYKDRDIQRERVSTTN